MNRIMVNGLWANPPSLLVRRLYRRARRTIPKYEGYGDPVLARQAWLRRVSREFDRLLRAAGIYVEGM